MGICVCLFLSFLQRGEEAQCQELVRYNALSLASPLDSLAAAATASSSSKRASMGPTGPTTEDRNAASSSTGTDAGASMSPSSTRLLDRMLQLEARVSRLEGGGAGPSSSSADGPKVPHSKGSAAQAEESERHDPEAYLMVEVGALFHSLDQFEERQLTETCASGRTSPWVDDARSGPGWRSMPFPLRRRRPCALRLCLAPCRITTRSRHPRWRPRRQRRARPR